MSLTRSIYYTFLTQAPNLLLFFMASTLMTRMLGDIGRGEYALLISQVAFLAMLFSLNAGVALTYYTAKAGPDTRTAIGTATSLLLLNAILIPLVLLGFSRSHTLTELIMPHGRTQLFYWAFVYFSVMMGQVNTYVSAVLLGLKKFKVLNAMSLLNAGLSATGFLLLYLFREHVPPEQTLPMVLIVSSVIMLVQNAVWCVLYARLVPYRPAPLRSWALLRPMIAFSLVGHLSNLINLINYRMDVWVVDSYQGTADLGLYAVAVGVAQLLFYIPEPFSRVIQPFLFGQQADEMVPRFKALSRLNFTAVLVCALVIGIVADDLLPLLFGETFRESAMALRLLLPGIVFSSTFKLLAQLVVGRGLQQFNLIATCVGAVVTIALDFALIPTWGIAGAAVASTIAYLVILIVVLLVIRYRLKIPVHDLFLFQPSDFARLGALMPWKPGR